MPIPALNRHGLLPPGVHECTLEDIRNRFVDLVLVLAAGHDLRADLSPDEYNVVSRRQVRQRFGFDLVVVRAGTLEYGEAVAFFQQVRLRPGLSKGILRLQL